MSFLKANNLKIGDTITLLELDNLVEKFIDNEEIETPLQAFGSVEVLSWGEYKFYIEEGSDYYYSIYFEIVENTSNENSIIRILRED